MNSLRFTQYNKSRTTVIAGRGSAFWFIAACPESKADYSTAENTRRISC